MRSISVDDFSLSHPDHWGEREYADTISSNLHRAKDAKNDEFYTRYEDIEKEVEHYPGAFKDKIVYCNCDREWSAFPRFFNDHRKELGLRGVLRHPGPFGGKESIAMLKTADIVATNPPFSHFQAFMRQVLEHEKSFLIIGSIMASSSNLMFDLLRFNQASLGASPRVQEFTTPDGSSKSVPSYWYTNLIHTKQRNLVPLTKRYDPSINLVYDNHDAIEVSRSADIPMDFSGVMGVPITFIEKYNPDQFEIVGIANNGSVIPFINGVCIAGRLFIRHKRPVGD